MIYNVVEATSAMIWQSVAREHLSLIHREFAIIYQFGWIKHLIYISRNIHALTYNNKTVFIYITIDAYDDMLQMVDQ